MNIFSAVYMMQSVFSLFCVFASVPTSMISYDEIPVCVCGGGGWRGIYFSFGFLFIFIPNKLIPSAQNGICSACPIKCRHYLPPAGSLPVFS